MKCSALIRRCRPRTSSEVLGGVLLAGLIFGSGLAPGGMGKYAAAQSNKAAPRAAGAGMNSRPMQGQGGQQRVQAQRAEPQRTVQGNGAQAGGAQAGSEKGALVSPNHPGQTQQHLAQWMDSHRNLPLAQQQSALEAEPGFHNLNPQEQERMRNQLTRLNTMPPEQRQLTIARTEWMARLAPPQRQQVRNAMAQLGSLPPERARAVGRAFRSIQNMPEAQRQVYLNSPQVRGQLNEQELGTLHNLLSVAPLIPPAPAQPPR